MHTLGLTLFLLLRTYDLAGVPPPELAAAERTTVTVLGRAKIAMIWVTCPRGSAAQRDQRCGQPHQQSDLIVRIIVGPPAPANAALADSYVDVEQREGRFATVYLDRVRRLAAASGIDPGTLIGRVIAHEIGHLLAGTSAHAKSGLMRAAWSAPMLRHDGAWAWMFSNAEAARLREKLERRLTIRALARADLVETLPPQSPCQKRLGLTCAEAGGSRGNDAPAWTAK